jgi:hypothetical protein
MELKAVSDGLDLDLHAMDVIPIRDADLTRS